MLNGIQWLFTRISRAILSVPVRTKIAGIMAVPVLILGFGLNYWITTGLSAWLSYVLSDDRIQAAMTVGSRSTLLVTFLAAIFSLLLSLLLTDILSQPILRLKKTAEQVAAGNFNTRAEVWANDEIGSLAISINHMIDHFDTFQEDLAQSNARLLALNRIALAADREAEIHDVLYIALENLLELTDLPAGWVYLYDPELERFHLASWCGDSPELEAHLLAAQVGNPGLCRCQSALQTDALGGDVVIRACGRMEFSGYEPAAARHITIPIEARDNRFGVINLSFPAGLDLSPETHQWLTSIGQQISEIVANAWLQMKLKEKESARQALLESLVTAQEEERSRLARELHDQVGQSMTGLLVRMKTWERKAVQPEDRAQFGALLESASSIIEELRDISYSLRPPTLEDLGLAAALEALAANMAGQGGFRYEVECPPLEHLLRPGEDLVLYRIAQEAFTNITRHAAASTVRVEIKQMGNLLQMQISDDGCGFDPANVSVTSGQRHLGLISMSERAELAGGWLEMFSSPGNGTLVKVSLPLRLLEAQ